jgi:hypothetical protein
VAAPTTHGGLFVQEKQENRKSEMKKKRKKTKQKQYYEKAR